MNQIFSGESEKHRVKDFTDWVVWKIAREMRSEIYKLASILPDYEKVGLASQLRRAATSVTANLAEGYGRFGYQENAHFCRQARGSVYELRDHIITCMVEHSINKDEGGRLEALAQRAAMLLNGYLRSTLARKNSRLA